MLSSTLTTPSRAGMWALFAGEALAGNLSRNCGVSTQVELAAAAADKMMEEFDRRFVFDITQQCFMYINVNHVPEVR